MDELNNLKTDENIGYILKKLKHAGPVNTDKDVVTTNDVEDTATNDGTSNNMSQIISQEDIMTCNDLFVKDKCHKCCIEDIMLPWVSESDKDVDLIHYASLGDTGNILYHTISADTSLEDLAALRVSDSYVCDVDFYKNRHYVLHAIKSNSGFDGIHTYNKDSDAADNLVIANSPLYYKYTVFTDLGIAEFIVKSDDLPYAPSLSELDKWFEDASNYTVLLNAKYEPHSCESELNIADYRYDIITVARPGVIVLDSSDNDDSEYRLCIKLKPEYSFIPMARILGCLHSFYKLNKPHVDFVNFINKYFIIM